MADATTLDITACSLLLCRNGSPAAARWASMVTNGYAHPSDACPWNEPVNRRPAVSARELELRREGICGGCQYVIIA